MAQAAIAPILGGLATTVLSGALSGGSKTPKTPTAPTPDDKTSRINKERELQRRYGSQGRASTVLSDSNNLG